MEDLLSKLREEMHGRMDALGKKIEARICRRIAAALNAYADSVDPQGSADSEASPER